VAVTVTGREGGAEIAVAAADNERAFEPRLYTPRDCRSEERGKGTMRETSTRIVRTVIDDSNAPRANLVVGADGVHSAVRRSLFGVDEPRFTGVVAWRGVIPAERLAPRLRQPVGVNWIGPGGHVIHYPVRRGELINYVSVVERDDWQVESWSIEGSVEECLADYPGWHPDVHALIRAIERPSKQALFGREPMARWSLGRATLLGDACHPTLPFLAQGAVMAIEDGLVLARCLDARRHDHAAAFADYERARVQRTSRVVQGSAANQDRFHSQILADARQAEAYVSREWSEAAVAARYDWLYRYDAARTPI